MPPAEGPSRPCDQQLLLQPHGFEGLGLVAIELDPHRETVSESVDQPVGWHLYLQAALLAATSLPEAHHDSLPRVDDLFWARVVALEGRKPLPHELPHSIVAVIDAGTPGQFVVGHVPHDLPVIERENGLHIPALPSLPRRAYQLHVLLRNKHRLRVKCLHSLEPKR